MNLVAIKIFDSILKNGRLAISVSSDSAMENLLDLKYHNGTRINKINIY